MTRGGTPTVRPAVADRISRVGRWPWLPGALVGAIAVLDLVNRATPFQVLLTGLLDEPAHLATAALVLLGVAGGPRLARHPVLTVSALAASMLIDIDHVPLYAGVPHIADGGGRPFSHSLTTVAVLGAVWLATGRRWPVLAGAAIGVCLHFVRDVATGPGLQLFWPATSEVIRLPYAWYFVVVVALGVAASARALRDRHRARSLV